MFCSKCGSQVNGNFCPKCGTPVNQNAQNPGAVNSGSAIQAAFQKNAVNPNQGFQTNAAPNLAATIRVNSNVSPSQGYQAQSANIPNADFQNNATVNPAFNPTVNAQAAFNTAAPVNNRGYAPVNAPSQNFTNNSPNPVKAKKKKSKAPIIIAIVAVLVIGLGVGGFFYFTAPETTIKSYVSAVNKMDTDKIIACVEPDAQDELKAVYKGLGGDQLEAFGKLMGDANPKVSIEIESKEKDPSDKNVVILKGKMTTEALGLKESEEVEFKMVKVGLKWYIAGDADIL